MNDTMTNPVKKKLLEGKVSFGSWILAGNPVIAEVMAQAGFDWIAADMEHSEMDVKAFADVARGLYGRGPVPMARVRENDTMAIRQVLDAGAWGIIVPMVNSAAEAERAVRAAKFPPRGIRGTANFRANDHGAKYKEYMANANGEILVLVMIETKEGVEAIDEILAVDGVDGVFVGPADLSLSYGIPGQVTHPLMLEARRRIVASCKRTGKIAGLHEIRIRKECIKEVLHDGFTFVALSTDCLFLDAGAKEAGRLAKEIEAGG